MIYLQFNTEHAKYYIMYGREKNIISITGRWKFQ